MARIGPLELILFLFPLMVLQIGLMVWALVDLSKRKHIQGNNKVIWVLVIVLINLFGPLAYFLVGRRDGSKDENHD